MENSPNLFAGAMPAAHPLSRASTPLDEWQLARAARVNVLLMGMPPVNPLLTDLDSVIRNVLERLLPDLYEPVASWCPGHRLVLPTFARARTLILHDVGALVHEDQMRLLEWLHGAHGWIQVVSTTPAPLLPRVDAGLFIPTLYYRLNTVCVEVTAC